jgi:serine/threonine protein kinase/pectin methylesterase-like acyl-CoA thioesterase
MSLPHDPDELIARLAAEESNTTGAEDATLAPLRAELETIESQIRQPRPAEPLLEESAYQRAAAQVVELGRELSHATRQQLEEPAADRPLLGELGQYKLLEKLGEGGMGAVYKAVHTRLKRVVALKVLPKERLQDAQAVARFQREMWAVGTLQHPNIVAAHDAGEIDGMHYLVMELVEGIDLGRLVSERGPLPVNAACELIRQAALGLQHAFEHNLVHRDIKPSNLMLAAPPNAKASPTVKILDLGLALLEGNQIDAGELTSTGQVMGTLDYMAPEQGTDTHSVDIRADIYSLGASLYKLLTGRAPFGDPQFNSPIKKLMALANQAPKPVESLRPDCPPKLAQLIARMLAKSPEERPAPPDELATLLEPFAQGADLHALLKSAAQVGTVQRHEMTVRTQHTADDPTLIPSGPIDADGRTRHATTQISQTPTRTKRRLVLALGGLAAALFMGAVITIATDQGTVEIEGLDDPAAQVQVKLLRNGADHTRNWQIRPGIANTLTVRSGDIEVQLPGDEKNEYEFVGPTELRVTRGNKAVFTLRRKPATAPVAIAAGHAGPGIETAEPPSLAEWLKGRKVLTVAQDGSGQFKTIQAALDAVQPGEAVKVLDKGPYRERLQTPAVPKDTGLFSEVQTVLEVPEWQPSFKYRDLATGADVQVYQGHRFEGADGFRLNGFEMFFAPRDQKNVRRLVMGRAKSFVLENCRIHASEDIEGEPVEISDYDWATNEGVGMSTIVRDCMLEGSLALGAHHKKSPPDPDRGSTAVVVRNYFVGTGTDHHVLLGGQSWARILIQQNVFAGKSQHDAVLGQIDRLGILELSNNTLESANGFGIGKTVPTGSVVIRNNLRSQKGLIRLYDGAESASGRVVEEWMIDHNAYPDFPAGAVDQNILPRARGDRANLPRFLSRVPQDADFLRLKLDDPAAAGGAGGEWPRYIGALPPGPAPQSGDWFTRLREHWGVVSPAAVADNGSPQIPEPPPLAEWLKGRTVLTVAQDGSGHFKTIQAALDAVQSGQAVKVLDRGPYRERLQLNNPPADIGLVSDQQTLVELAGWETKQHPDAEYRRGHVIQSARGFRLSGFALVATSDGSTNHHAVVYFEGSNGVVVEDCKCTFADPRRAAGGIRMAIEFNGFGPDVNEFSVIRDCVVDGALWATCWPEAIAAPILFTRNLIRPCSADSGILVQGWVRKASLRNNVVLAVPPERAFQIIVRPENTALESIEVTHNTVVGAVASTFELSLPKSGITIRDNVLLPFRLAEGAEQHPADVGQWEIANNWYHVRPESLPDSKHLAFRRPDDPVVEPKFLSSNPKNRNFARLMPVEGLAAAGALPAGPAPSEGDWFTRLNERWGELKPERLEIRGGPISLEEPPPLADWLKGRTVLTVAQDGSGQFKTIQAALDAAKSGQAVKVLDRGPYRERLELHSPPADIGLISEVQTRIEISEYGPDTIAPQRCGHYLTSLDRFRFHGLEFVLPQVPAEQIVLGMHLWEPHGVVFENCAVRCKKSPRSFSVVLADMSVQSGSPCVVRDCLIENRLQAYSLRPVGSVAVLRNYFAGDEGGASINGTFKSCRVQQNIFAASLDQGCEVGAVHADHFELTNNTFLSSPAAVNMDTLAARFMHERALLVQKGEKDPKPVVDRGHAPTGHGVIYNNLHSRASFLNVWGGGELDPWTWEIGYNCYPGNGRVGAVNSLPRPTNTLAAPVFLSDVPEDRNFARLKPDSPGATSGAGGKYLKYAGALPPGPAPQQGDWFTRLQERWMGLPAQADDQPATVAEPPPLAEWLKGRQVLTVAQDGSGQFKTIQAALDALQKGQVVKVLDRGPYREQLNETGLPPDSALISEVRTIVELPQWSKYPSGLIYGHSIRVTHGFRIHGIGFDSPNSGNVGIIFDEADGLILENCQFRIPTSDQYPCAAVAINSGVNGLKNPLRIRDCRFDGQLGFNNEKARDRDVLITRNYFTAAAFNTPLVLGGTFRKLIVRNNVLEGKTFTWAGLFDMGESQKVDFSHNTFIGDGGLLIQQSVPRDVDFTSNLFAGAANIDFREKLPAEWATQWKRDRNFYQSQRESGEGYSRAPLGPTDRLFPIRFLSKRPGSPDYARLPKPEGGATDEVPEGVGALPAGPTPEGGDWFTRLQESWFEEPGR